jgi:hypothetical protein
MLSVNNYYNIPCVLSDIIDRFLILKERRNLYKLSKATGCLYFERTFYKINKSLDPERRKLAEQTFLIITKSVRFSLGKKYACLNALVAAISSPFCSLAARMYYLAVANIPHFILTRCWELRVLQWGWVWHYDAPITKRAFLALIQAYKNSSSSILDQFKYIPNLIMTEGSCPRLGPRDPSRTDYAEPMTENRQMLAEYHKNSDRLAFNNISLLTEEVCTRILHEVNTAIAMRLKGESTIAPVAKLCVDEVFFDPDLE